jgi:hypothetical protein
MKKCAISKYVMSALLGLSAMGAVAQVTVNTPDEELLEGHDVSEMFDVLKPIARLSLEVDGIEKSIGVMFIGDEAVLMTDGTTDDEEKRAIDAYIALTGDENVTVRDKSDAKNSKKY